MSYAFFPGCSLKGTAADYGESTLAVFSKLGLELTELDGWVCCGSTPAHNTSHLLSVALPAKNLQLAVEQNGKRLAVACAACFSRLRAAWHEMSEDALLKAKVEGVIEGTVDLSIQVRHLLQILTEDFGLEALKAQVAKPLEGLKVACYYGCLLVRPPKVMQFDEPENPQSMDSVMTALGATPVAWPFKTECCGANLSLSRTDLVLRLVDKILSYAKDAGAEVVAVACPLCQANLDVRQVDVAKKLGTRHELPVVYFTQLVGVAVGVGGDQLGLDKSFIDARPKLQKWMTS